MFIFICTSQNICIKPHRLWTHVVPICATPGSYLGRTPALSAPTGKQARVFAPCNRWQVCPNEQHPINRWETFPPPHLNRKVLTESSAAGLRWAQCVPPVNTALHIHPILACIFIVHHVFICVCLCVWETREASVLIWEPCRGVRQDAARGKKSPAAFGLVSASRKASTMLHVRYPKVSPLQGNLSHFLFSSRLGTQTSTLIQQHRQRGLQLTCPCVSCAIRLICGIFPPE